MQDSTLWQARKEGKLGFPTLAAYRDLLYYTGCRLGRDVNHVADD